MASETDELRTLARSVVDADPALHNVNERMLAEEVLRLGEVIDAHHEDFIQIKAWCRRQRDGFEPRLLLEEIDRIVR